jgi:hypothetical protein
MKATGNEGFKRSFYNEENYSHIRIFIGLTFVAGLQRNRTERPSPSRTDFGEYDLQRQYYP